MATAATLGDRVWITMQSATKIRDPIASKESCVTASSTSMSFTSPLSQQTRVSAVDARSSLCVGTLVCTPSTRRAPG